MNNGSAINRAAVVAMVGLLTSACTPGKQPVATLATPTEIGETIADAAEAPLTLVHVWATWCQPCREEFPDLLKAYSDHQPDGLALKLVSADDPDDLEAVEDFLKRHLSPVGSLVSTELSQEFIELFSPQWSGALPASFFFNANGQLVAQWEGKHSYEHYVSTIEQLLKP